MFQIVGILTDVIPVHTLLITVAFLSFPMSFSFLFFSCLSLSIAGILCKHAVAGGKARGKVEIKTTPLRAGLENGNVDIARFLVEPGASADVEDCEGRTPLNFVSEERCDEILKLLLKHRTN